MHSPVALGGQPELQSSGKGRHDAIARVSTISALIFPFGPAFAWNARKKFTIIAIMLQKESSRWIRSAGIYLILMGFVWAIAPREIHQLFESHDAHECVDHRSSHVHDPDHHCELCDFTTKTFTEFAGLSLHAVPEFYVCNSDLPPQIKAASPGTLRFTRGPPLLI